MLLHQERFWHLKFGGQGSPKGAGRRKNLVGYTYMYKYAVFDIKLAYVTITNFSFFLWTRTCSFYCLYCDCVFLELNK